MVDTYSYLNDSSSQTYTVLVVDDNLVNLDVMFNCLDEYGYDTLVAEDGEGAILQAQIAKPDIILLDVTMPGMDGFETCMRLKADVTTKEIPVIFMTALDSAEHKVKGFEVGGVDYVTKPVQQDEVLARLSNHLRLQGLNRELQQELRRRAKTEHALRESQTALRRIYQQEQERRKLSDTLREVARIVSSTLNQDEVLELILSQLEKVVVFDRASVSVLSDNQLTLIGVKDKKGLYTDTFTIPANRYPLNVETLQNKQSLLLPDVSTDERWAQSNTTSGIRSFINAPLLVQDEPIGLLGVGRSDTQPYTQDDSDTVFAFATQVAIALRNAQLAEQTRNALRDKDKFFSIVAHDLRGPFMPFIETSKIMAEMAADLQPDEIKDLANSLHHSAKNVYQLLENLLEWGRLQMGRMAYQPQQFELNELAARNIDLLRENAANKQITLVNEFMEPISVYADHNMVNTVLRNLISNALKFTPKDGSVTVRAEFVTTNDTVKVTKKLFENNQQFVKISVSDTGVGIPAQDIGKLFRIGEKYTTLGTNEEKGTGLGLILCREMIDRQGGEIWVESTVGQGSTFMFTLPTHPQTDE